MGTLRPLRPLARSPPAIRRRTSPQSSPSFITSAAQRTRGRGGRLYPPASRSNAPPTNTGPPPVVADPCDLTPIGARSQPAPGAGLVWRPDGHRLCLTRRRPRAEGPPTTGTVSELWARSRVSCVPAGGRIVKSRSLNDHHREPIPGRYDGVLRLQVEVHPVHPARPDRGVGPVGVAIGRVEPATREDRAVACRWIAHQRGGQIRSRLAERQLQRDRRRAADADRLRQWRRLVDQARRSRRRVR